MIRPDSASQTTVRSPLGELLAELRARPVADRPVSASKEVDRRPPVEVRLETRVASDPRATGALAVRWLLPASVVLHAAALFGLVVGPLLRADALPPATRATRVFFVAPPLSAPIPPPPPAPARPAAPRVAAARPSVAPRLAEPLPIPIEATSAPLEVDEADVRAAESGGNLAGEPGRPAGGIAGGAPGGVIGGVLGGVADLLPPVEPVRVGGEIREPAKIRHVAPAYPDVAIRANVQGSVVLECTVSPMGKVTTVTVVRGVPLLNEAAMAAVKQWIYTPTLRDGVPVPVIMTVTVRFGLS
jgi:protein TonB